MRGKVLHGKQIIKGRAKIIRLKLEDTPQTVLILIGEMEKKI